jgi:hypothetical protein
LKVNEENSRIRIKDSDPDPLVRGMDPRIRIRIHPKISWIRNKPLEFSPGKAENEVACLPDVDVVPCDVVQEQERLPRGQRVQVRLRKKSWLQKARQYGTVLRIHTPIFLFYDKTVGTTFYKFV